MGNTKIGFWGYPPPEKVTEIKRLYPDAEWIDLDVDIKSPDKKLLPDSYCKIIKNIVNNTFYINPNKILAPIGKDKCDSGWFAAELLKNFGFDVIQTKYEKLIPKSEIKISTSNLPLHDKITKITDNIINKTDGDYVQCKPKFGFWGVPPNDLNILKLFPNETHVYGWTRCVEAGTPADIELEMSVDVDVPTVFYAQAFCSKTLLAKYLADKYNGLFIDIDDYANNSVYAKIEAFLRLR